MRVLPFLYPSHTFISFPASKMVQAVTFLTCIRELLPSNLDQDAEYPEDLSGFPQYLEENFDER
jgi:hypothetical protein